MKCNIEYVLDTRLSPPSVLNSSSLQTETEFWNFALNRSHSLLLGHVFDRFLNLGTVGYNLWEIR